MTLEIVSEEEQIKSKKKDKECIKLEIKVIN